MMDAQELATLIATQLNEFYKRRVERLGTLKLRHILRRKNPYLYRAIGIVDPVEVVDEILKAYLSSSDEGIFGDIFFEPIAKIVSGGVVSPSQGVDIAIETADQYMAIAMKSGPNPYNASQVQRQNDEFESLRRRLIKLRKQFDPVLGHGYGRKQSPATRTKLYRDSSGQAFWEELTGDSDFYLKLIRLMDNQTIKNHRDAYYKSYMRARAVYLQEFLNIFCQDGNIDWEKLLQFNSGKDSIKLPRHIKQEQDNASEEEIEFIEGE